MAAENTLAQPRSKVATITFYTYTVQPMTLLIINFPHLTVSEIQPKQDFKGQCHYGKVKG